MLIRRQDDLVELVSQLLRRGTVGFDTEFIRERRYFAQLCLVQVRAGTGADAVEALLDPFELNLEPLALLIADESVVKIVHAGSQDLQIFYQRYGLPPRHVFDTQIAGAFLGYGQQAGYADLVAQVEGGQPLSKASQFTDWAARPLSQAQMEYALEDVRHLHALYETLHRDLQARGRLEWAETEFRRAEEKASTPTAPDELYGKLNTSGLNRKQLAALRELAAQRDAIARDLDRPVGYVLPDAIVVHVAKQQPATVSALRSC
jgi:ribonuclease D